MGLGKCERKPQTKSNTDVGFTQLMFLMSCIMGNVGTSLFLLPYPLKDMFFFFYLSQVSLYVMERVAVNFKTHKRES